jgi:hypothetical protein
MDTDNVKKWKSLLEKWRNFSKVYDAIFDAYRYGYNCGNSVESGRKSEESENTQKRDELLDAWKHYKKVCADISEAFECGYNEGVETEKYCREMRIAECIDLKQMLTAI